MNKEIIGTQELGRTHRYGLGTLTSPDDCEYKGNLALLDNMVMKDYKSNGYINFIENSQ